MEIQNFITKFKKTFVYEVLSQTLTDEQLFAHTIKDGEVIWFKEQMRQMWTFYKAQAVPEGYKLVPIEPSNNATPEIVNNDVTYVIELQGYEAIEHARVTLKKKGYKTWDYTDKESINDSDIYVLCFCPSTPNESAFVKGTFKGIHQGKFTYIQTDLESCPYAQEPVND